MEFYSDFHCYVETRFSRHHWKKLGTALSFRRRVDLMKEPGRATNPEILLFERVTQIPAAVLIEKHGMGREGLTEDEIAVHIERHQHKSLLPPYEELAFDTTMPATYSLSRRNRRPNNVAQDAAT